MSYYIDNQRQYKINKVLFQSKSQIILFLILFAGFYSLFTFTKLYHKQTSHMANSNGGANQHVDCKSLLEEVIDHFEDDMLPNTHQSYIRRWTYTLRNKSLLSPFLVRQDVVDASKDCDANVLTAERLEHIVNFYPEELVERFRQLYTNKHSLRTNFQGLLKIVDNWPYLNIDEDAQSIMQQSFRDIMMEERAYTAAKTARQTVPYNEIKDKVAQRFGTVSKEYLLILLYEQVHARDDFGKIFVVGANDTSCPHYNEWTDNGTDTRQSYIVWPDAEHSDKATLYLNHYKTVRIHGRKKFVLRPYIVSLMRQLGIRPGMYLIRSKHDKTGRTPLIATLQLNEHIKHMLEKTDLPNHLLKGGGINFLRHSIITQRANQEPGSIDNRLDISRHAFHSPTTTLTYHRNTTNTEKVG